MNLRWFYLILLFIVSFNISAGEEDKKSPLYYLKLGAVTIPGNVGIALPTLGVGARFQKGYYGLDLSANLGSMFAMSNYISLKSIFLLYPQPIKQHQLYMGCGPGLGFCSHAILMGGPLVGGGSMENSSFNLEGVLGYEFRHPPHYKTFIQFEISQPVIYIKNRAYQNYIPGIGLSVCVGF